MRWRRRDIELELKQEQSNATEKQANQNKTTQKRKMGNSAGTDAMGHGTGNCHEVCVSSVTVAILTTARESVTTGVNNIGQRRISFNSYVTNTFCIRDGGNITGKEQQRGGKNL